MQMHMLGMTDSPYWRWYPTQSDPPEHLVLHFFHHHLCHVALLHSISALQLHKPTLIDFQGGSTNPNLAFKTLNLTRTFLHKKNKSTAYNLKT